MYPERISASEITLAELEKRPASEAARDTLQQLAS
jgi:hypothetical protein